jgi:thiol-disulfide isomerase/thioredoxin
MTLETLEGETINTADLRGKIIVFNVWATWCPPCKAELPDFNELASEYDGEVVFIAVHCYDSAMYDMPSYVADNFPDTKIIFAYDTPNSDAYIAAGGVGYVPQTAIIDRNGIIIYSDSGALTRSWLASFIENNNKE